MTIIMMRMLREIWMLKRTSDDNPSHGMIFWKTCFLCYIIMSSYFQMAKKVLLYMPRGWISRLKKYNDFQMCTRPTYRGILGDGIRKQNIFQPVEVCKFETNNFRLERG